MTIQQKKKLVFIHHSLWVLAKDLPQDETMLIDSIMTFRNKLLSQIGEVSEDKYSTYVYKRAILLHYSVMI